MKTNSNLPFGRYAAFGACVLNIAQWSLLASSPARAELAQVPLEISHSGVDPNVMLLMDDSGSMDNIIWASGYEPSVSYNDWSYGWDPDDGNVHLWELYNCSTYGFYYGSNGSSGKCLKLPDPVGGGYTRYDGNYLNYLFSTYATGTDLTDGTIPNDYRMSVARDVANSLVQSTENMRFCLADFNYSEGGGIGAECGANQAVLTGAIEALTASNWTPLSESYYEITRYFRGLRGVYSHTYSNYSSPIQFRCQQNFVIAVTDGYPTYDLPYFPAESRSAHGLAGSESLPDWDGLHPPTTPQNFDDNTVPQYSDGFASNQETASEGGTLYLDDLAKFGYYIDLKKGGNDQAGKSYQDPAFEQQNLKTYTVGFAVDNQMLEDAAHYGTGQYYTASNAEQLGAALQAAIASIHKRVGTNSAGASNLSFLGASGGGRVYGVKYDSSDWSGDLLAFRMNDDPGSPYFGTIGDEPEWKASEMLPDYGGRHIFTWNGESGNSIDFSWDELSYNQQSMLVEDPDPDTDGHQDPEEGAKLVAFLRGDGAYEGSKYRERPRTKLGDIVHSSPVYVAKQDYDYPAEDYQDYLLTKVVSSKDKTPRQEVIYVGANDGMLHAFNAKPGRDEGKELMAFVPISVFEKLAGLSEPEYNDDHRYLVDGPVNVMDARLDGQWQTVLISAMGAGARGLFALNVSDPEQFSDPVGNDIFLWEINERTTGFEDMGHVLGDRPSIIHVVDKDGVENWFAVTGNGVYSDNGRSVLYIINLEDGSLFQKFVFDDGNSYSDPKRENGNGLSTPAAVDLDSDTYIDRIYAGDIKGNVWRVDWDPENGGFSRKFGSPLFQAAVTGDPGTRQPIVVDLEVARLPGNDAEHGIMLFFGTGKYYETEDRVPGDDYPVQSFYGVLDDNESSGLEKPDLLKQEVVYDSSGKRATTRRDVNWDNQHGWYLDLSDHGERVVYEAMLIKSHIWFGTLIPNEDAESDPCISENGGWFMRMEAFTGRSPKSVLFDINEDGVLDSRDMIIIGNQNAMPTGKKSEDGAPVPPTVIRVTGTDDAPGKLVVFSPTTSGNMVIDEVPDPVNRKSWRRVDMN